MYGGFSGDEQLAGYQEKGNFAAPDYGLCRMWDHLQYFAGKKNSGCADTGRDWYFVSCSGADKQGCDWGGRLLDPAGTGSFAGYGNIYPDALHWIFLAAFWSGILLVIRRKSRKTEIPLVPFLLAGYIGGILI